MRERETIVHDFSDFSPRQYRNVPSEPSSDSSRTFKCDRSFAASISGYGSYRSTYINREKTNLGNFSGKSDKKK